MLILYCHIFVCACYPTTVILNIGGIRMHLKCCILMPPLFKRAAAVRGSYMKYCPCPPTAKAEVSVAFGAVVNGGVDISESSLPVSLQARMVQGFKGVSQWQKQCH